MTISMDSKIEGLMVETTRSCRNKAGGSTSATFKVDFTGCTVRQVLDWATSSRVISGQRVWEKMNSEQITSTLNGKTLSALTIGKAPVDNEKLASAYMNQFKTMSADKQRDMLERMMAAAKLDADKENDNDNE
jgi:hypothetical protein